MKGLYIYCNVSVKYALYTVLLVITAIVFFLRFSDGVHQTACDDVCILQIDSFAQASDVFQMCDDHMLVTFDVDDTLIAAHDLLARVEFPWLFKLFSLFKYPELIKRERWEWAASIMLDQAERFVFDSAAIPFIQRLQQQKCTVIGLTSVETGIFGIIESMEQWRADMLQRLGIDLSGTFEDVTLDMLPSYRGNYPVLYRGILCANQQDKGLALGAFLNHFVLKPDKVVSFDDNKQALSDIGRECKRRKITFIGYHFLGAQPFIGQWDMWRALKQLDYIMQESRWVPDIQVTEH